jgi:ribonuclease P/MRP protein subunit RPP40
MILPDELWRLVEQHINGEAGKLNYSKVHMSLLEIISGDFFNHYIKTGTDYFVDLNTKYPD